jgi:hypothetical protein
MLLICSCCLKMNRTQVCRRERAWYASANSYTFATFSTVRSCNHKPRHLKNEFTEASYALCYDAKAMNSVEKRIKDMLKSTRRSLVLDLHGKIKGGT